MPNLRHLASEKTVTLSVPGPFYCVMPSSRWEGKQWKATYYLELIQKFQIFPVVLGTQSDRASLDLVRLLKEREIAHLSGVGLWDLKQAASVIDQSEGLVGVDTGLVHLAESLGKRVFVVYGPTHPDMGFGPSNSKSVGVSDQIWCQPCGKDGRRCHRFWDEYACMRKNIQISEGSGFFNDPVSIPSKTS